MFSVWSVTKAAGVSSYLLLFVSVIMGTIGYSQLVSAKHRGRLIFYHQWTGWFGFLFGLLHGIVLLIDTYEPFSIIDLLVPFFSPYKSAGTGLGIIALYMYVAVMVTSDWMKLFGRKVWRIVHYLPFAAYILALLHGLLAGSDSSRTAVKMMYAVTGLLFLVVIAVRMGWGKQANNKEQGHAYTTGRR
ncbi:ferric reductase-like transmembrane domain-containing protein [Paenibacillus sp. J5C_2022]|uniref:ferric reductase-like transmembrane domain-containing protein n=1 Tax=Paenibacillus sp. J5C2022 TaxID=2977129 RepID=UPI0021D251E9|nr:ferric reductase-like transmembrane domain-containing protein [Paenibacillus sp. J5C2022]MCU6712915.1 ferric reductase-like transmembrane domain-containing protein [Paenibacillus sp. J5C2022]